MNINADTKGDNVERITRGISPLIFLSLLVIVAHGVFVPVLGFYWDDVHSLWVMEARGVDAFAPFAAADRPAHALPYMLMYQVMGDHALYWQILGVILQIAAVIAVYAIAAQMSKGRPGIAVTVAVLYAVYPGFSQHGNAFIYTLHKISLVMALASIALTLRALTAGRAARVALTAAAVGLALATMLLFEYFIGFEALRILLVAYLRWRDDGLRRGALLRDAALRAIPYLIALGGFLVWRLFFFSSTRAATSTDILLQSYTQAPLPLVALNRAYFALQDWLETLFLGWVPNIDALQTTDHLWIIGLIALIAALMTAVFLLRMWRGVVDSALARHLMTLGLVTALITLIPTILAGRDVEIYTRNDRYTLPAIFSVGLFFAGALALIPRARLRAGVLSVLVGVAVFGVALNADVYRRQWQEARQLWGQLAWRAPAFEPETVLVIAFPDSSLIKTDDPNEIWPPVNLIYAPDSPEVRVPALALYDGAIPLIQAGETSRHTLRTVTFARDFGRMVLIRAPTADSCLRVIEADEAHWPHGAREESLLVQAAPYSDASLIIADAPPASVPALYGDPLPQGWCYFFALAERARQLGDWDTIISLHEQAEAANLSPRDVSEWRPFIEAYSMRGDTDRAAALCRLAGETC